MNVVPRKVGQPRALAHVSHDGWLSSIFLALLSLLAPSAHAQPLSRAQMLGDVRAAQDSAFKSLEQEVLLLRRQRMGIQSGKFLRVIGERQKLGSDWNPENPYWGAALRLLTDDLSQQSPPGQDSLVEHGKRSQEQTSLLGDEELRDVHRYFTSKAFQYSQSYFTFVIRTVRALAQRDDENAPRAARREAEAMLSSLKEPHESPDEEVRHRALLASPGMQALYRNLGGDAGLGALLKQAGTGESGVSLRWEKTTLKRVAEVIGAFRQGVPLDSIGITP